MPLLLSGKRKKPLQMLSILDHILVMLIIAAVNDACNSLINDKDDIMSDEVPILNYWPLIKTACFSVTKQLIKGRFKKVRGSIVSHGCHLSHYKICPAL